MDWNKKDHGKIIHSAVVNNPHNLVYGPKGTTYRGADPDLMPDRVDREILAKQNKNFRREFQTFENARTLENFGKLSRPDPVDWEKRADGKFYVKGVQKDPSTNQFVSN